MARAYAAQPQRECGPGEGQGQGQGRGQDCGKGASSASRPLRGAGATDAQLVRYSLPQRVGGEQDVGELLGHDHELVEADDTVAVLVGLRVTKQGDTTNMGEGMNTSTIRGGTLGADPTPACTEIRSSQPPALPRSTSSTHAGPCSPQAPCAPCAHLHHDGLGLADDLRVGGGHVVGLQNLQQLLLGDDTVAILVEHLGRRRASITGKHAVGSQRQATQCMMEPGEGRQVDVPPRDRDKA